MSRIKDLLAEQEGIEDLVPLNNEYMTTYVKATCKHCGNEIILKVFSKTTPLVIDQELD